MSESYGFCFVVRKREEALLAIKKVYPGKEITDSPDSAGELLDFVEKGVISIMDPSFHGSQIEVMPGKNWDDSLKDDVVFACKALVMSIKAGSQDEEK